MASAVPTLARARARGRCESERPNRRLGWHFAGPFGVARVIGPIKETK
jgi:hypothetical protein